MSLNRPSGSSLPSRIVLLAAVGVILLVGSSQREGRTVEATTQPLGLVADRLDFSVSNRVGPEAETGAGGLGETVLGETGSGETGPKDSIENDSPARPVTTSSAVAADVGASADRYRVPTATDAKGDDGRRPVPALSRDSEVVATCRRIGSKLGSVSTDSCLARGLTLSSGRAVSGAPILVREYPPAAGRDPLGRVLLIGGIHGDEYSSVSIVFKWMETLDRHHSGLFHWQVVPLLNPDGLLRERSQRMNASGVDLNRNFPTPNWEVDAVDYWERRTSRNPRRYPGPNPLSEPESLWLAEEIESFRPSAIVAVHAPFEVVDYDGPPEPPARLGPLYLMRMGTYPGSLGRYAGEHMGLPVITIELPSAGIMPSAEEQHKIWTDLVAYLRGNLPKYERARTATAATGGR